MGAPAHLSLKLLSSKSDWQAKSWECQAAALAETRALQLWMGSHACAPRRPRLWPCPSRRDVRPCSSRGSQARAPLQKVTGSGPPWGLQAKEI